MLNPTYLTRSRHDIFYFRWPLPQELRQPGKTSHIKISLRTREPKEALRLANILEYHVDSLMKQPSIIFMNYAELKQLVDDHFRVILQRDKEEIDREGPLTAYKVEHIKQLLARDRDITAFDQFWREMNVMLPHMRDSHLQAIIKGTDIDLDPRSEVYAKLRELFRIGSICRHEALLDYSDGQSLFSFSRSTQSPPDALVNMAPLTSEPLTLIIQKYTEEMLAAEIWSLKAANEREDCFDVLKEILGDDLAFRSVSTAQARNVKEVLMRLPKNRSKMLKTRDMPILEQIKVEGVETLSVGSVNKYLQCYSSLFLWAVKNGYADKNPFVGMSLKESSKKKRDQFSPDQVKSMLHELSAMKERDGIADYAYWGALIGIYTGARLNEIASLTPNDIRQENGIWYFDINDQDEMKRLKTNAAMRRVPIHSALISLGLLEYIQSVKSMNIPGVRVLHDLTYSEKEGWGRKLGRWFNTTFLETMGIKKKGLSFHSLRHTAITAMRRAGIERPIVQAIVGHEPDGVTEEVYTHGYELSQLQTAIESLRF